MSRKIGAPRMNVMLHGFLTLVTAGVFVPIWFSWVRQWLDTLVPGMRIPCWAPGVSLALSLMAVATGLLALMPFEPFMLLTFELVAAMCLLGLANGAVITVMAMRTREILMLYSEEHMPIVYDVTTEWTIGMTSQQLQHHINTMTLIDEWEPRQQVSEVGV